MGSLGGPEIILILVLALLLLGPRKLPEVGRTLAKALSEFRKATYEFRANLEREVDLEDVRRVHGELKAATSDPPTHAEETRQP
ncbi:MAG TPA: twin-arginine translocase TatA/TatE family subunit [Candidatus Polarisedimenticolaceae bacterium]|nr:twin-arginine translocase TatA/TatE family subunit [Candidatus Polarisedimenticolaceae bacterium]